MPNIQSPHLPNQEPVRNTVFRESLVSIVVSAITQVLDRTTQPLSEIEESVRAKVSAMSDFQVADLLDHTKDGHGVHMLTFRSKRGETLHKFGLEPWRAPAFLGVYNGIIPMHEDYPWTK